MITTDGNALKNRILRLSHASMKKQLATIPHTLIRDTISWFLWLLTDEKNCNAGGKYKTDVQVKYWNLRENKEF